MLTGVEGRVVRIANRVKILVNVTSVCQAIAVEVHVDDIDLLPLPVAETPFTVN